MYTLKGFTKSLAALQSILNDIETNCDTWGLKINTDKTTRGPRGPAYALLV